MPRARESVADLIVLPLLLLGGTLLWIAHAGAWDLGGTASILDEGAARAALAAREFMWHGRWAMPFALPIELALHPHPPWPLTSAPPALVMLQAAIFRLVPARGMMATSDSRAWLTLPVPFATYLFLGASIALATFHLLRRGRPDLSPRTARAAALTLGLAFLLDPEVQQASLGLSPELPCALALLFVLLGFVFEAPANTPFVLGLLLGIAGLFRAGSEPLALVVALVGAWSAPAGKRWRALLLMLAGFALPMAPWWWWRWHTFGSPTWEFGRWLARYAAGGDPVAFAHQALLGPKPVGPRAWVLDAGRALVNARQLAPTLLVGPRAFWLGGLVAWLALRRPPRPLAAAALAALAMVVVSLPADAVATPGPRALLVPRLLFEPVCVLALWSLLEGLAGGAGSSRATRRVLQAAVAALALAWGTWGTMQGNAAALATRDARESVPSRVLTGLSVMLGDRTSPADPVMSNLGPAFAWQTTHPVIHLAQSPDAVEACRHWLDFHDVLLVVRPGERLPGDWEDFALAPGAGAIHPRLGVVHEVRLRGPHDLQIVWLQLGALPGAMAARAAPGVGPAAGIVMLPDRPATP